MEIFARLLHEINISIAIKHTKTIEKNFATLMEQNVFG